MYGVTSNILRNEVIAMSEQVKDQQRITLQNGCTVTLHYDSDGRSLHECLTAILFAHTSDFAKI